MEDETNFSEDVPSIQDGAQEQIVTICAPLRAIHLWSRQLDDALIDWASAQDHARAALGDLRVALAGTSLAGCEQIERLAECLRDMRYHASIAGTGAAGMMGVLRAGFLKEPLPDE